MAFFCPKNGVHLKAKDRYGELASNNSTLHKPEIAVIFNDLAILERALPNPNLEVATSFLIKASQIYRELVNDYSDNYKPQLARTLNNLGNVQRKRGHLGEARSSLEKARDILSQVSRQRSDFYKPFFADIITNLANVYSDLKYVKDAFSWYKLAISLYNEDAALRPKSQLVERRNAWYHLGLLYLRNHTYFGQDYREQARAAFREAVKCIEAFRGCFRDFRQRHRIQSEAVDVYEQLMQTCVEIASLENDPESLKEAVSVAEALRARNLNELLSDTPLPPAGAPPNVVRAFYDIRDLMRRTERSLNSQESQHGSRELPKMQRQIARLHWEYQQRLEEIQQHDRSFDPDKPVPPIKYAGVLPLIPDDVPTAVVQYTLTRDRGFALVITREGVQAVPLPDLNDRHLSALTHAWGLGYQLAKACENPTGTDRIRHAEKAKQGAFRAYEDVEKAIQSAFRAYEDVFGAGGSQVLRGLISGMTTWHELLPALLEAIAKRAVLPIVKAMADQGIELRRVNESDKPAAGNGAIGAAGKWVGRLILSPNRGLHLFPLHASLLADCRYLSDACEVVYTPSLSILHLCASRRRSERSRLCLVENPTCDKNLPFTGLEGARLRERYRSPEMKWLYGGKAAKDTILEKSRDCHVLAYTGHSRFDATDPLNSALQLGSATDDHLWLTLRDIYTCLKLPENLLTIINGCESGMVQPDRVDEYVGLPSGFLYAGAACVLTSLWHVNDLSCALLMDRFHQEWHNGKSIAAALHAAQCWLRDDIRSGPYLRQYVLPPLLATLKNCHLKSQCEQRADYYAAQYPDSRPFASPVHWAPFIATGLSYPLAPG